jgi:hypothetical protein
MANDPKFVRDANAEARAIANGTLTAAEVEARGGINKSGYYGDSWSSTRNLSDAEYAAAALEGGGVAINKATAAKSPVSGMGAAVGASAAVVADEEDLLAVQEAKAIADEKLAGRKSAYDTLYSEFNKYGLGSLVEEVKTLITDQSASPSQFALALQGTEAYQKRFSANKERIKSGLTALSPAEYLALEDQYQNVMRNYGLPASYYTRDSIGKQEGFDKFIAGDVSAVELEDRIMTAQNRVINSNPEISYALKNFYPDITNGDILAYALNPSQGLTDIKRKITSAEIGGAAMRSGLTTSLTDAEYLQRYGVDKAMAEKGYSTIGGGLQRGSQLASIYGENPYTQTTAEQEVFNIPGQDAAKKQRQKITGLEKAAFGAQTGISSGALTRDRAGAY